MSLETGERFATQHKVTLHVVGVTILVKRHFNKFNNLLVVHSVCSFLKPADPGFSFPVFIHEPTTGRAVSRPNIRLTH